MLLNLPPKPDETVEATPTAFEGTSDSSGAALTPVSDYLSLDVLAFYLYFFVCHDYSSQPAAFT